MAEIEGVAPGSIEAQVLADLQKEGHQIGDHQPIPTDGEVTEQKVEEKKVEVPSTDETKKADVEESKPDRSPTMVEAWKLKVAEDQKDGALKKVADLEAKITELSQQSSRPTENQKQDIVDDIEELVKEAEEAGADGKFIRKLASTLLSKAEAKFKPSDDVTKTIKELAEERELAKQERLYVEEFSKNIEPLVKEQYGLDDTALSQLKSQLKDLAFSDTYAKVPLAKIFKAEFETFGLKEAKRSSEGKGVKVRSNEVVDYDNMTEEQFSKMTPDQVLEFSKRNSSGWNRH